MKGSGKIIELLNEVLTGELTGINQYFVHAKMCDNWGYERLAEAIRKESMEETTARATYSRTSWNPRKIT
jgi:bacterioferritin